MTWKKIASTLLFPPFLLLLLLLPLSLGFMLYGMLRLGENHPFTIAAYAAAFYTLVVWCIRLPHIIHFLKTFKEENKYTRRWFADHRLRMNVTVGLNVLWNGAYGLLQLGLGIFHHSAWFYSLAAYYACLALMRFFLVQYTLHHEPGRDQRQELTYYRACGWIFLLLNLALSAMMFDMIRQNRTPRHHEITTIAMATYTFLTLTMAIVNLFRYRKLGSPVLSASRAVSLAAACVSMLSLENTMLTTFGSQTMAPASHRLMLGITGGFISLFIIVMAIYMITQSHQKQQEFKILEDISNESP